MNPGLAHLICGEARAEGHGTEHGSHDPARGSSCRSLALGKVLQNYLLKSLPRKQILEAIRKSHAGKRQVPPEVATQLAEYIGNEPLSGREIQVLEKIAIGKKNGEIAALLFITEETVKNHVKHILGKLGASDRTEAVTIGFRRGIIRL